MNQKEYTFEEAISNIKPGETYKATKPIHTINTISFRKDAEILDFPANEGVNLKVRYIKVQPKVSTIEALTAYENFKVIKSALTEKRYSKCLLNDKTIRFGLLLMTGEELENQWIVE